MQQTFVSIYEACHQADNLVINLDPRGGLAEEDFFGSYESVVPHTFTYSLSVS